MNGAIDEPELLTEIPPVLKRLAKVVVRGFYDTEQVAIINVLTNAKHPCVKEDDLMDLVRFDKRQLRQALVRLKNDKLIKQRIHKEKAPDTGMTLTFNYYFINFKVFVNVVKYKLDHVRKKIESDEKQAKNRPSFVCSECHNKYSDLEVDRLIDMTTGLLKCTYCSGTVEEDTSEIQEGNNKRTSLAKFNEQIEPIFKLLRDSENINLADAILEPEPDLTSINKHVSHSHISGHASRSGWASDRYGMEATDLGIKISMGAEDEAGAANKRVKEAPIWMKQSTVHSAPEAVAQAATPNDASTSEKHALDHSTEDEVLADLLAHESVAKKPKLDIKAALGEDENSSSSDSDSEKASNATAPTHDKVTDFMDAADSDDEEEEHKIKVNGKVVALGDVTDDMMKLMSPEEEEAYHKAFEQAYSHMY
ncbi:general transcription factor IIE subunit 1 [Nematostella vectensis]|uniref:general transcription factor IIE subunit 1 n=1 Tax=Nematostella vectensis TaxID=45351 RepID=UPI0020779BF4|nr:general transcription factor IIE subunit 1 [Nematostella vectensis]